MTRPRSAAAWADPCDALSPAVRCLLTPNSDAPRVITLLAPAPRTSRTGRVVVSHGRLCTECDRPVTSVRDDAIVCSTDCRAIRARRLDAERKRPHRERGTA